MPADLPALRDLLQDQTHPVGEILRSASRMKVRLNSTSLLGLVQHIRSRHQHVRPTAEYLDALRVLAGLGFGRLLHAQVRHRATFRWAIDPRAVCAAAFDPTISFQPQDYLDPAARPPATTQAASAQSIPEGWRQHSFPLRPEGDVILLLPADLTPEEARRLGHLLLAHARSA